MEQEMVVADNITQQLIFLGIDALILIIVFAITYWYVKYGSKNEIIKKFASNPLVQNILIDMKYVFTNVVKLKAKEKMKEKRIGENSDLDKVIPPELIQKYGDSIKTLSKESIEKLKELENKNLLELNQNKDKHGTTGL